jgi:hypothetical protein
LPVGLNVRGVAYGKNRFVAVGLGGSLTSTNGLDWSCNSNAPLHQFLSVAFGMDRFVTVGNGTIQTSPDGINWTARSSPFRPLSGIAYGNGMFIALEVVICDWAGKKSSLTPDPLEIGV